MNQWRYDPDNLNVYSNGMIAQVFGHTHNGEKLSNARLIAAAPELLEALKCLTNEVTGFLSQANIYDHGQTNINVLQSWITHARTIINKAEGFEHSKGEL